MTPHTDIYKLCTAQPQAFSEQLYDRLRQFLEDHVDKIREVFSDPITHYLLPNRKKFNIFTQTILNTQSDLLSDYLKYWGKYSVGAEFCHQIFRYLVSVFHFR
jgi:predicted PolB exonuclease-like 3'-5' exonuclease